MRRPLAAALVLGLLAFPTLARPATEEFSTFDVERPEEDDESLIDHYLTRSPRSWRESWERSPRSFQIDQGCLTAGQWIIQTRLRMSTPVAERTRFGVRLTQSHDDLASYDYLDLELVQATGAGAFGIRFRPVFDKSRQDVALTWEHGADTTALQVQAAFTFEDAFNNLWEFRQSRVGEASEPYVRHPYEPALRAVVRRPTWRGEIAGKWLTPSRRRIAGSAPSDPFREATLWGARGEAAVEVDLAGWSLATRTEQWQASSTDRVQGAGPVDPGDDRRFRRLWSVEASVRRRFGPFAPEALWIYRERTQRFAPPTGPGAFQGVDRTAGAVVTWEARPNLHARLGALHDRISIDQHGASSWVGYGTRTESRAFIGLDARFGNLRISAVEGFELDPEPYEVWWVHDKGFFQIQAVF